MTRLTTYRRIAFALGTVFSLSGCGDDDTAPSPDSSLRGEKFMLVHGAWNGAWVWEEVEMRLEERGATVRTVTLPGHADDATPVSETSLAAYVDAVLAEIPSGAPVTLVGHSFGGVVISLTAERAPERVKRLVYVGAFLPENGETALGLAQTDTDSDLGPALGVDMEKGLVGIEREAFPELFCADCNEDHLGVLAEKYSDEPLPPLVEPIELSDDHFGSVPKYYVYTAQDRVLSPAFQQRVTARVELAGTATIETSHSPFFSAPEELVATIDELLAE